MSRIAAVVSLIVIFCSLSYSQNNDSADYRISKVDLSSGRGALSSGIFASVEATTTNGRTTMIFQVTSTFVQGMYGAEFGSLFLAGSAGYFENTPWIGPFAVYTPTSYLTLVGWAGVSAGLANEPAARLEYSFTYLSARVTVGPVYATWASLSFQSEAPNHMPGGGISFSLGKKITCSVGSDYSLRDQRPLFSSCLSYTF